MPDEVLSLDSSVELDATAALEFLRRWSDPPWALVAIEPKLAEDQRPRFDYLDVRTWDAATEAAVLAFLERNHNRSWNQYFTPFAPAPALRTTPRKAEVALVRSVHVDLDLPHPPALGSAPTLESYRLLYARVRSIVPTPTLVSFSGGGFQALWRLTAPLVAAALGPGDRTWADRVEAVNRAIERALGGDNCHNVNRILRLPGTVNFPDFRKRARGRVPARALVVTADWDRSWSFDEPVPTVTATSDATLDPTPDDALPASGATFSFADLPAKLQRTIRQGDASPWAGDRSDMVWYVVTNLVRRGWPDEAIRPFLLEPAYALSNHVHAQGDPRAYADRQLERARSTVAEDWERAPDGRPARFSPPNVRRALTELGAKFSFDTFALRQYVNGYGPRRPVDKLSAIDLRFAVRDRFQFLPDKDLLDDVMYHLSRTNGGDYHPVCRYLDALTWDEVPRLGMPASPDRPADDSLPEVPDPGTPSWLTAYGGAVDSPYVRMVGRLILVAAVRRVRQPGCKFDEILVLVNPVQGTDKSSALQTLAKNPEWFSDNLPFGGTPKQVIERLAGKWIVEASDLTGMRRADIDEMKRFLSSQVDEDRLAYDRYRTELPRQWVPFGTTNSEVFLRDSQNRRFWPVRVGRFDLVALRRDVDQLWAEAARAEAAGESIRLPEHYWGAAAEVQEASRSHEPWVEEIGSVLGGMTGRVVNSDVWKIVNKPIHQRTQDDNRRLGEAMRELGFERTRAGVNGRVQIVYARGDTSAERNRTIYVFRDPLNGLPPTASYQANQYGDEPPTGTQHDPNELPM